MPQRCMLRHDGQMPDDPGTNLTPAHLPLDGVEFI